MKRCSPDCPYCKTPMRAVAMRCPVCDVEVRGRFGGATFSQLRGEDLEFLENYLLAGFNIKSLEQRGGMGYAAIRTRLDRLIARYRALLTGERAKKEILDRLDAGEITAEQAAELMRGIQ